VNTFGVHMADMLTMPVFAIAAQQQGSTPQIGADYWQNGLVLVPKDLGPGGLADDEVLYTLETADGHPVSGTYWISEVINPQGTDNPWNGKGTAKSDSANQFDDTIGQGLAGPFKRDQYFIVSTENKEKPDHFSRVPVLKDGVRYWSQTIYDDKNRNVTIVHHDEEQ
jgi:hypothetical protein